jgi:hypothetical protein
MKTGYIFAGGNCACGAKIKRIAAAGQRRGEIWNDPDFWRQCGNLLNPDSKKCFDTELPG